MDYRQLGRSGVKVSPLGLGAMMFGGRTDEATATRIIHKACDQGVNFIDTADQYNAGESEVIVGRAIQCDRDSWVLATNNSGTTKSVHSTSPLAPRTRFWWTA